MTKQEEVDKILILATGKTGEHLNKVKRDLSNLGVVIKVERELPSGGEARLTLPRAKHLSYWRGWDQAQIDMTRAGYVVVEPLI